MTGEALGWPLATVGTEVDGWLVGCSVVVGNSVGSGVVIFMGSIE